MLPNLYLLLHILVLNNMSAMQVRYSEPISQRAYTLYSTILTKTMLIFTIPQDQRSKTSTIYEWLFFMRTIKYKNVFLIGFKPVV